MCRYQRYDPLLEALPVDPAGTTAGGQARPVLVRAEKEVRRQLSEPFHDAPSGQDPDG